MFSHGSQSRRARRLIAAGVVAAVAVTTAVACVVLGIDPPQPAPVEPEKPQRARLFYWSVTTDRNLEARVRSDLAQKIDFAGAPIRRDMIILYGQFLGHYPRLGLHQAQKPGYMDEHLKQVRVDVQRQVPQGFKGPICIDYENWNVLWDRTANNESIGRGPDAEDTDYKDDWRDHQRDVAAGWSSLTFEQREQLCKATYEAAARDFFLKTLTTCKAERPDALWGFYDYPMSLYIAADTGGRISYNEDGTGLASERNDQLGWLFSAVDALFPSPYALAEAVPDQALPSWASGTNSIEESRLYIYRNVRESVRCAKGKPVICYMWPRYMRVGSPLHERFLNDVNLRQCLEVPFEAGADGVAIWESINKQADVQPLQDYVRDKMAPIIIELSAQR